MKITKSSLEVKKLDEFICNEHFGFSKEDRLKSVCSQHPTSHKNVHQCEYSFITISLL